MDRIDLVRAEREERLRGLVGEVVPEQPFGVYLVAARSPESEPAREIESGVFAEWFGNSLSHASAI